MNFVFPNSCHVGSPIPLSIWHEASPEVHFGISQVENDVDCITLWLHLMFLSLKR